MNLRTGFLILFLSGLLLSCGTQAKQKEQSKDDPIVGKWEVIHSTLNPFDHISYCSKLTEGAHFVFNKENKLLVYPKNQQAHCNDNQSYSITSTQIEILEFDMIFFYDLIELNSETLKIKINRVPKYVYEDSFTPPGNDPDFLNKLRKEGILLSLKKVK